MTQKRLLKSPVELEGSSLGAGQEQVKDDKARVFVLRR